jgi:hypothetical protein
MVESSTSKSSKDSPEIQFLGRAVGDVCHLLVDVHSAPLRIGNPDAFLRGLDDARYRS